MLKSIWLLLLSLTLCSFVTHAETVVLKSGKALEGDVINQTETSVILRTVNGTLELRRADIVEIRKEAPPKVNAPVADTTPNREQTPAERETIRKISGGGPLANLAEKPQKCPKCTGTGIAIWLECLNCNKSGKPGYKNFGDYWEVCKRCTGAGRIAAAKCNTCLGKGNVLLSQIKPADGGKKDPPKGSKWCEDCDGTGAAIWSECPQCKRSKFPGYLFHGDSVTLCNRCNGAGKFPGLGCGKCKQKGVLHLSEGERAASDGSSGSQ